MKKQTLRLFCTALVFTVATSSFAACELLDNEIKYDEACALIESGDYEGAYAAFKDLGDYKDSEAYLSRFVYFPSVVEYSLYDRSGVMTVTLGSYNMPVRLLTKGMIEGQGDYTKDGWYTYDGKGNVMRQAMTYNSDFSAYDYTYDANNNLIKAEYSVGDVVSAVHDYVYNEDGLLIRESYMEGDVVYYDYVNSYDANGNLVKSVFAAPEGDRVYTYVYDGKGNLVNESGNMTDYNFKIDYTYDDAGKLTKEVCFEYEELNYTVEYTYDTAGNCIKEECSYADGTKCGFTREYDANGNMTKEVLTGVDGTVESVEYQYVFTYITIDVPASTMNQIVGIFDII